MFKQEDIQDHTCPYPHEEEVYFLAISTPSCYNKEGKLLCFSFGLRVCYKITVMAWYVFSTYAQDKREEGNDAMFLLGNIMIMLIMRRCRRHRRDVIPSFFPLPSFIFSLVGSLERFCKKPRAD